MAFPIIAGIKLVAGPLIAWLQGRQDRAVVREEGKVRIEEARVRGMELRAEREAEAEGNYDLEAMKQMRHSWKDEWLMLVLTLPFIGSFIPHVQDYVVKGWGYVAMAPHWYQWAFLGIIAATFGLRWLFQKSNPLSNKKGPDN